MLPGCLTSLEHGAPVVMQIPKNGKLYAANLYLFLTAQCDDGHRVHLCAAKRAKPWRFYGIFGLARTVDSLTRSAMLQRAGCRAADQDGYIVATNEMPIATSATSTPSRARGANGT